MHCEGRCGDNDHGDHGGGGDYVMQSCCGGADGGGVLDNDFGNRKYSSNMIIII